MKEESSFSILVRDLVARSFGPDAPSGSSRVARAFETLLSFGSADDDDASASLEIRALTRFYNAVSLLPDASPRPPIDEPFQLATRSRSVSAFERASRLIDELRDSANFLSPSRNADSCSAAARILLFLCAAAAPTSSARIETAPSPGFYCPESLLLSSEEIFGASPGCSISGSSFFSDRAHSSDYSRHLSRSLYSALTRHPPSSGFSFALSLPALPDDPLAFEDSSSLLPSHLRSTSGEEPNDDDDDDEGFGSSPFLEFKAFDDLIEKENFPRQVRYLTESGAEAFDRLQSFVGSSLAIVEAESVSLPSNLVDAEDLLDDLKLLLFGLESPLFRWKEEEGGIAKSSFSISVPRLALSGLEPNLLSNFLSPFLRLGKSIKNLELLCDQRPNESSLGERGLVYQSFLNGIRRILHFSKAFVVSRSTDSLSPLQFSALLEQWMSQVETLVDVCRVRDDLSAHEAAPGSTGSFPVGTQLLSYLYDRTSLLYLLSETDTYPLLLFLLLTSLQPYLRFLSDWVFHGQCSDPYGEFGIKIEERFLSTRDRRFWTKGYAFDPSASAVPSFLLPVISDIFSCGKSLNLLRLCCHAHPLARLEADAELLAVRPELTPTLNERQLRRARSRCLLYATAVEAAVQRRRDEKEREERRRREEEKEGTNDAEFETRRRMRILKEKIEAKEEEVRKKKRKEFEELKREMEEAEKRKKRERKEERDRDAELIRKTKEKEEEMETKIKEEMIRFYEEMEEKAEERERRALWRLKRTNLDGERREFLAAIVVEEGKMAAMKRREETAKLPSWAAERIVMEREDREGENEEEVERDDVTDSVSLSHIPPPIDSGLDSASAARSLPSWASAERVASAALVVGTRDALDETLEEIETPEDTPTHVVVTPLPDPLPASPASVPVELRAFTPTSFKKSVPGDHVTQVSSEFSLGVDEPETGQSESRARFSDPSLDQSEVIKSPERTTTTTMMTTTTTDEFSTSMTGRSWTRGSPSGPHPSKSSALFTLKTLDVAGVQEESDYGHAHRIKAADAVRPTDLNVKRSRLRGASHPSYSTVQNQLYPFDDDDEKSKVISRDDRPNGDRPWDDPVVVGLFAARQSRFRDRFLDFDVVAGADLMGGSAAAKAAAAVDDPVTSRVLFDNSAELRVASDEMDDDDNHDHLGSYLPFVLRRCIEEPLRTQIGLVDAAVVELFEVDLRVRRHFASLRQFLLMEDGEFSQRFSDQLFERIAAAPPGRAHSVLNPLVLNNFLREALRVSSRVDADDLDRFSRLLSFAVNWDDLQSGLHSTKSLASLEIRYSVPWPLNVVISESSLTKYSKLFAFMLQLKQAVWYLKDIFHSMKKVSFKSSSPQIHKLQLFRHEMLHFVTVVQSFIANQVIHNCWSEFMDRLDKHIYNLDSLYTEHAQYLNTAIQRCLLNPKSARAMDIIQGIFAIIEKFRRQLLAFPISSLQTTAGHPNFQFLTETYESYVKHSHFLFRCVAKLADVGGRQPHLYDFVSRLNFNQFYRREN